MKAALYRKYGGPEVLEIDEIPEPGIKDDEILVKVMATSVNRSDCANLTGKPFIMKLGLGLSKPRNPVGGTECSGVVVAIGKDVKRFSIGDAVFAFNDAILSCYAEYFSIKALSKNVNHKPENLSFQQAAVSLEGSHYARNFLNKLKLTEGDCAIVHGGGGGIGSAMIQLANHLGLRLTATCRKDQMEVLKQFDIDKLIDYEKVEISELNEQFDFFLDSVGKSTFRESLSVLKKGGVYISSELGPGGENLYFSLITALTGSVPGTGRKVKFPYPPHIDKTIELIQNLAIKNKFTPVIDKVYPFREIGNAFEYVLEGQKTGNVVIDIA